MAVTYKHGTRRTRPRWRSFQNSRNRRQFSGVGYDHNRRRLRRPNTISWVTNTPDVPHRGSRRYRAPGLLISTFTANFVKADRYLRSGLWTTQQFPLSVGSLRDRKVGMVGMGRIGQAIGPPAGGMPRSRGLSFAQIPATDVSLQRHLSPI